jgi:arginase
VRDDDVVVFGRRDAAQAEEYGSQRIEDTPIVVLDLERVRANGAEACAEAALECVARPDLQGFWLHLDADVLDDSIMPAVDYRMAGGLSWDELSSVIGVARRSDKLLGMNVTIFNPSLDPGGRIAPAFADTLVAGLSAA